MMAPHISVKVHKVVDHNFVNFIFSLLLWVKRFDTVGLFPIQ